MCSVNGSSVIGLKGEHGFAQNWEQTPATISAEATTASLPFCVSVYLPGRAARGFNGIGFIQCPALSRHSFEWNIQVLLNATQLRPKAVPSDSEPVSQQFLGSGLFQDSRSRPLGPPASVLLLKGRAPSLKLHPFFFFPSPLKKKSHFFINFLFNFRTVFNL